MLLVFFYLISFLNIIIALYCARKDLTNNNPFFFFWFFHLSVFLIPALLDPMKELIDSHQYAAIYILTDDVLVIAQLYILVFSVVASFFYRRARSVSIDLGFCSQGFTQKKAVELIYLSILATVGYAFVEFFSKFGLGGLVSFSFLDRRELLSPLSKFILSYNLIACSGLVFYFFTEREYVRLFCCLLVYFSVFLVLGGSRQPIAIIILPFVLCLLSRYKIRGLHILIASMLFWNYP